MKNKGFPVLSILCLGAAFLYLGYAGLGLFQDHYIGEHFKKAIDLQFRLQTFGALVPFGVLIFQYEALRNMKVYFAWMIFSIMLIGLYYAFMKDRSLMVDEGRSSMNGFKNLFFSYYGFNCAGCSVKGFMVWNWSFRETVCFSGRWTEGPMIPGKRDF